MRFFSCTTPYAPLHAGAHPKMTGPVLSSFMIGIVAFPYYCPGARRCNVFVSTWLLCPRLRSASIALYASPTVVLARFSVWFAIFDFFS